MSSRSIRVRLARLEAPFAEGACPVCGPRTGFVKELVVCEQAPGGELIPLDGKELPEPCPRCGQMPEVAVEILEVVTSTHDVLEAHGAGEG
jgi:hypothetical protein